ncbi:ATP-binding protein [Pseudoalteromonas denitrificans]|jgi:sigma-B regulation protein RsbU (phosphoserine phosphatase)|uniref:Anti-sigma regulatory factor (Ser/Thr protein kinase) n=1 Tax=Pseudoalteromonas denitrificans DSM 6059 TaxID=1123010 RepID=A0A1I1EUN6_9GAMM|nr:ATP-binding protein [Pseudoalteromonas denitrificans]SFB89238.1 Anti-sigma regulatory factor (Ser/Thr protein kinase) [Pseudoalteromonas denitrificans DSM 6059]
MSTLYYRRFNLIWAALTFIRQTLLFILKDIPVSEDDIDKSGLVMTEYLSNLLRHSNGENEAVTLVLSDLGENIRITLIDPTLYCKLLKSGDSDWELEQGELVEGGMGLALIKHYFDDYQYTITQGKNYFSFEVPRQLV